MVRLQTRLIDIHENFAVHTAGNTHGSNPLDFLQTVFDHFLRQKFHADRRKIRRGH